MQYKPSRVSYTVGLTHRIRTLKLEFRTLKLMTKDHKMDHFQLYKKRTGRKISKFWDLLQNDCVSKRIFNPAVY